MCVYTYLDAETETEQHLVLSGLCSHLGSFCHQGQDTFCCDQGPDLGLNVFNWRDLHQSPSLGGFNLLFLSRRYLFYFINIYFIIILLQLLFKYGSVKNPKA